VREIASALRGRARLGAFMFARFNKPAFHLGLGVLGAGAWLEASVRPLVEKSLAALVKEGVIAEYTIGPYAPEEAEYGGEEGMRLTERLFHHDSLACLDLMEVEAHGGFRRTRREYSLLMVERLLDQMRFGRDRKLAFYERGYKWALKIGSLNDGEVAALEKRYQEVKKGLAELVNPGARSSAEARWGGAEAARIAEGCLAETAPVIERAMKGLAAGTIKQDPVELAWSWTRVHSNRLGVLNVAEASLRFFMHRLHEDAGSGIV